MTVTREQLVREFVDALRAIDSNAVHEGEGPYPVAIVGNFDLHMVADRLLSKYAVLVLSELEFALGDAWDDGNGTGLDGWVGPGRGAGEVDDQAVFNRQRNMRLLLDRLNGKAEQ